LAQKAMLVIRYLPMRAEFAAVGGLIRDGSRLAAAYRDAGIYAGKILMGSRPDWVDGPAATALELSSISRPRANEVIE